MVKMMKSRYKDSKDWYIIHSSNQSCMTEANWSVSDDEVEDEFEEDLDLEDDDDNAGELDEQQDRNKTVHWQMGFE